MKSIVLYTILIVAISASVFFTYQRSFVWGNYELVNSEEDSEEELKQEETLLPNEAVEVNDTPLLFEDTTSSE